MPEHNNQSPDPEAQEEESFFVEPPSVSLPKGGGGVRGLGEKFTANPVTGTGSFLVPIFTSPGRSGFGPDLSLSYDSGSGNGPFGFGWSLSFPAISRKTDKGLPKYQDSSESDVFILSGTEDLVPLVDLNGDRIIEDNTFPGYTVYPYRPRIEGLFSRIERWTNNITGETHWRSISRQNITTLYGKGPESRIADPDNANRVFKWLISESFDDKGNIILYEYAAENSAGIKSSSTYEKNRTDKSRSSNRYLKRIKYGNQPSRPIEPDVSKLSWLFEVVFDYGEGHYTELPLDGKGQQFVLAKTNGASDWSVRQDPFSIYRARFDVRSYRLCRRVLMFHHFNNELNVPDYLVRSTEFDYDEGSIGSFIKSITQSGFARKKLQDGAFAYLKKSLPSLQFDYSKPEINSEIEKVDPDSLENMPIGLDSNVYQWVDLDNEGITGILTEQGGGWHYKRNLSPLPLKAGIQEKTIARFAPLETVKNFPSPSKTGPNSRFQDLAGDGKLDLVLFSKQISGFFERTDKEGWNTFKSFKSYPNVDWTDPNLRFIDLTGDGLADILITEDEVLTHYQSLGEKGFSQAEKVSQALDEEKGPKLVFADAVNSIYLADFSGDGLTDLVRIKNGKICYWPNLGYGRFGAKVTMGNSPWFEFSDQFDQQRIRLVDIDGSGTTDLIYLGRDKISVFKNQAGNSWSQPDSITRFPSLDNLSSVVALDLLGIGTGCLVWSTPLSKHDRRPMQYIDLMGRQKPHLLTKIVNNLGAETNITYAPSTKFYLKDKIAGKPWLTKIPFPVHVVERVETLDRISGNRFTTRYAYHQGFYDSFEREFRGFGEIEQWDTEEFTALNASQTLSAGTNINASSNIPPVLTRTWFHTGIYLGRNHVSDYFAGLLDTTDVGHYFREPGLTDSEAEKLLLKDSNLPPGLTAAEEREACRALKGLMLRQEIYALDGSAKEPIPYAVTEQNFSIEVIQNRHNNRHGVFFTYVRETINYNYERDTADPRTSHSLTLETDEFGNVLKQATISYGRRQPDLNLTLEDQNAQSRINFIYNKNSFSNPINTADVYRTPLPSESRTFEVTGVPLPAGQNRFTFDEVLNASTGATAIEYQQTPAQGVGQKRLIEHIRTLYRADDLSGPLTLGVLEPGALPFESYKLALTSGLIGAIFGGRVTNSMLEDRGHYVHSEGDSNWWIPSGRVFFSPNSSDTPAQELAYAKQHFFLLHRYRNPFHTLANSTETFVKYDPYDFLVVETKDPLDNRVTIGERDSAGVLVSQGNNYRVLQPEIVMDPNRNQTAVTFDALGFVVATAIMGKPEDNPKKGDSLDGVEPDLPEADLIAHLQNPFTNAQAILGKATSRLLYDVFAYERTKNDPKPAPTVVYTMARETHEADLQVSQTTNIQHSFSYSDGFGREIQKKIQAEPGPVPKRDPVTGDIIVVNGRPEMTTSDVSPRWVGNGWTVFNNKNKAIRKFEPFFTDTHRFESDVRIGVSPVLFYDPVGRVVATLNPNHTWGKVLFNPWRQETWDASDTCLVADPKTDPEAGDYFSRLPDSDYLPTWHAARISGALGQKQREAAEKTAIHAGTPAITHFDPLGQAFLTIVNNKLKHSDSPPADPPEEEFYEARMVFDIEGNEREVIDAKRRIVMRYDYDMLGTRIHQASMEAGERWILNDVAGQPLYAWDSRGHQSRLVYDQLRRPIESRLTEAGNPGVIVGRTVYGETRANPEANNLRGQVVKLSDQAGVVISDEYDFKGNLLTGQRQLAKDYKTILDWGSAVPLETETHTSTTKFDALSRPVELTAPDTSIIHPGYNEANFLERLDVNLKGAEAATPFITDIDYDAKGQRRRIDYATRDGVGITTIYDYDPDTFRLIHLKTTRNASAFDSSDRPGEVQNLTYTYDPIGNITHIRDDAQNTVYFRNRKVEPSCDYTYDALYRLIEANGREHLGQVNGTPIPHSYDDAARARILHRGDGNAMGGYFEKYIYDEVGNFLEMVHRGNDPVHPGWTREYTYDETSQLEPAMKSNRLTATEFGSTTETYSTAGNGYDEHGNMLRLPQLQVMEWDFKNRLKVTQRQAVNAKDSDGQQHQGERTYFVYDSSGERVRKVTEGQAAAGQTPKRKKERIYLGGFEIYREYKNNGTTVDLERETLHIMDNTKRIALVETRTKGNDGSLPQLIRYQHGNHLGTASLELDDRGDIISYEEYTPYGSTAYQAVRNHTDTPKRYRYTGKERDEETGLSYHGARYYAPWLARWTSSDPAGLVDGPNLFRYARNSPVALNDTNGKQSGGPEEKARGFKERAVSLETTFDYGSGEIGYTLNINLQNPKTGEGYLFRASGDLGGLRSIHTKLLENTGFAQALTGQEREALFSGLEDFAESVGPVQQSDGSLAGRSLGAGGYGLVYGNPPGHTMRVDNSFDAAKMNRYRRATLRGEIGRNAGPGASTRVRRNSPVQRAARTEFVLRNPIPTQPPPGGGQWNIGHKIDLMHDIPGQHGTSAKHYQWEPGGANQGQGTRTYQQIRNDPLREPAGGVARVREAGRWYNSPTARTAGRGAGRALLFYGIYQSGDHIYEAIQADIEQGTGGVQTAEAVAVEAGGWAGALLVAPEFAAAGAVCGPGAWACIPAFGLVGGAVGYFSGSSLVEWILD